MGPHFDDPAQPHAQTPTAKTKPSRKRHPAEAGSSFVPAKTRLFIDALDTARKAEDANNTS